MLALGCGLVASIGITQVIAKRHASERGLTGPTKAIFVATTDIGMGDLLNAQVLKLEQWPKDKVPPGAITRIEDVEGRRTRTKLYAGEPILENRLLGKGASEQGATALIPKGYRVVPVSVNLVSGGSSLILPGDRVDVMVHFVRDPSRDIQETVTRTILQDIKVFAVNDVVGMEDEKDNKSITAKTISLLVTPDQAAKVTLASQLGTIQLVMRSPEDDEQAPNAQAKPGELFGTSNKSNRDKETLMAPDGQAENQAKKFLDFLNSMKSKASQAAQKPSEAAKAHPTWTVRVIKPGSVDDVVLEEDPKTASVMPFGFWKTVDASSVQNGAASLGSRGGIAVPDVPPSAGSGPAPADPAESILPQEPPPATQGDKAATAH